ncbi:MAG TPA: hypothetical protein PK765_04445, partial [bacterium]|nr:hypothetical protein [bacterium]
ENARSLGVNVSEYERRLKEVTPRIAKGLIEKHLSDMEARPDDSYFTVDQVAKEIENARSLGVNVSEYERRLKVVKECYLNKCFGI